MQNLCHIKLIECFEIQVEAITLSLLPLISGKVTNSKHQAVDMQDVIMFLLMDNDSNVYLR